MYILEFYKFSHVYEYKKISQFATESSLRPV
jgi:hypothetical protein